MEKMSEFGLNFPMSNYLCFGRVAIAGSSLKWEDMWITVQGFWLIATKKMGDPGHFVLPLHLSSVSGAFHETGIQNSLCLITSAITGGIKLYLQTANRYDIIRLFQSVKEGQRRLEGDLDSARRPRECEVKVESAGFFKLIGKSKLTLKVSPDGIKVIGGKTDQMFDLDHIQSVYPKVNDSNASTHLCFVADESGQMVSKEYVFQNHADLATVLLCFLMNTHVWNKQNLVEAHEVQEAGIPEMPEVGIPEMADIPDLIQMIE